MRNALPLDTRAICVIFTPAPAYPGHAGRAARLHRHRVAHAAVLRFCHFETMLTVAIKPCGNRESGHGPKRLGEAVTAGENGNNLAAQK